MNPWEQFLTVQRHDTALDQLDHRRASIPERDQRAAIPDELAATDVETAARDARRDELVRSQRRLEDEIASLGERREQASAKLYGGSITAPKDLGALQDDIASIERRISTLEDETLDIMELLEPVEADLSDLADRRAAIEARAGELEKVIAEAEAVIDAERATVVAEREIAIEGIPADLVEKYEKTRAQLGGVAVARLVGGVCDGCHLTLPAMEVDRIKHLPLEEPVTCEECGRFLVRS